MLKERMEEGGYVVVIGSVGERNGWLNLLSCLTVGSSAY